MPIASSNTARGKSRSPAPPPPSRSFLPPSHYAAAAGYSSSKSANAPSSLDELSKAEPQANQAVNCSQYDDFMPMSQHSPGTSSPESFSEYKLPKDTRFSFIAEARIISPRNSQREKRQSTLTGLPNIETQLLPSLRDTIDRMTRPPSRPPPSQPNQTDASAHRGRPPDPADVVSVHDPRQMRSHHPTTEVDWMTDAPEITLSSHSNDTPPLVASTPKLKAPSYSALKSSLRTPTPKLPPPDNAITHTPVQHASGGSLRSVKSFLGRKISFTTPPSSPAFVTNRSQTPRKSSLKVCINPSSLYIRCSSSNRLQVRRIHQLPEASTSSTPPYLSHLHNNQQNPTSLWSHQYHLTRRPPNQIRKLGRTSQAYRVLKPGSTRLLSNPRRVRTIRTSRTDTSDTRGTSENSPWQTPKFYHRVPVQKVKWSQGGCGIQV